MKMTTHFARTYEQIMQFKDCIRMKQDWSETESKKFVHSSEQDMCFENAKRAKFKVLFVT